MIKRLIISHGTVQPNSASARSARKILLQRKDVPPHAANAVIIDSANPLDPCSQAPREGCTAQVQSTGDASRPWMRTCAIKASRPSRTYSRRACSRHERQYNSRATCAPHVHTLLKTGELVSSRSKSSLLSSTMRGSVSTASTSQQYDALRNVGIRCDKHLDGI